ncbi:uncharacterized protein LOC118736310 [Rhagoletis pomonella]|uniref:uncharacterized protein LOC118736310 n=1 Tax=Rhagoletis pomonella TaxID=28610 RepID=UPI00177CB06E|nr:uncharacterized protein LOC118736310 [Rhagoletis pomonella]
MASQANGNSVKRFITTSNFNDEEDSSKAVTPSNNNVHVSDEVSSNNNVGGPNEDVDVLEALLIKLQTIEMNQQILSENQSLICEKLNYIMENSTPKCETSAQHQLLRECKVSIKKVEHSVCRMTGELRDKHMDDVASALPLQTSIAVLNVEDNLKIPEYARAMVIEVKI